MRTSRTTRAISALAAGLALSLVTACGSTTSQEDSAGSSASSAQHNDADVSFAQDMLVHHSQALTMVELTDGRSLTPEVKQLATEIKAAQAPEIKTFTTWLKEWDEEVPDASQDMSSMEGMEGMDHDMPGMMSGEDMTKLEGAPDSQFQSMWLEMMIEHHEGAVDMAKEQIDEGKYEPAISLAEEISTSQTAEVAEMKQLLAS
ncbi:DUF305 domain-containing protein [Nocardioides aurantiacus]|uniref:DUF305 domain-containing protein n=1 Tax=Nocardioides aurantiacus TaxID=86796 RepID=UPI00403F0428